MKYTLRDKTDTKAVNITTQKKVQKTRYVKLEDGKSLRIVDRYYNIPCSYDIETSSFTDDEGEESAIVYSHCLNINNNIYKVESWIELILILRDIREQGNIEFKEYVSSNILPIYVHNLQYEFAFMKHHFDFQSVFCIGSERKVLRALTKCGIEFRCSYMLTGKSLESSAKDLVKFKVEKLTGDIDHELVRTPKTKITEKELQYIINDVLIIEALIREEMDKGYTIVNIPLTSTGYVREYCRNRTMSKATKKRTPNTTDEELNEIKEHKKYQSLIKDLNMGYSEYVELRAAFAGGYTHANALHTGKVMKNVTAKDFISSYPARMVAYQFPMGKGELYEVKDNDDFMKQINSYCCLFKITFHGIVRKANISYLSGSKAVSTSHAQLNNGRVESAEKVTIWMTEQDFRSCTLSYEVDSFEIHKLYRYRKGYLPTSLIECILKLFKDKTELKDVSGREADYIASKEMLNSIYGMCVTDPLQDVFEWEESLKAATRTALEIEEEMEKIESHNINKNRFLFYPWGVWITAYSRYDLVKDVIALGDDFIYCDTDSIYFTDYEKNERIFEDSNRRFYGLLDRACNHHGIDMEEVKPKCPKGVEQVLGLWDFDGFFFRFKTLGAKRYMVEDEKGINITVSGVNKLKAVPYMLEKYGEYIFEYFNTGLVVPEEHSGKMTHAYIDVERSGTVTDYMGNKYQYYERSGIHLSKASYSLSISEDYINFFEHLQSYMADKSID